MPVDGLVYWFDQASFTWVAYGRPDEVPEGTDPVLPPTSGYGSNAYGSAPYGSD